MPSLFALSDIHISNPQNLEYFLTLLNQKSQFPPNSGLILAGDVGESISHLRTALEISLKVFRYVWWVPGNHELYTIPRPAASAVGEQDALDRETRELADEAVDALKGEGRYMAFVKVSREYENVFTPEDEWVVWDSDADDDPVVRATASKTISSTTNKALICPLFTLYDYSFRPAHIPTVEAAKQWASEADIYATDEALLHPDPYPNRESWCHALIPRFQTRLATARKQHPELPFVLINHWPLSQQVLHIPAIPRFSLWCGSTLTESWTEDFAPVSVVVSGHLHVRRTDWIDGVRWEEVSLGYPRQWAQIRDEGVEIHEVVREILPGPDESERKRWQGEGTRWRRFGGR